MINMQWFTTSGSALLSTLLSALGIYVALLLFTRLAGLRSFSKMSSFDFAITVAFGSVVASTLLSKTPALPIGVFGLAVLYAIQFVVSRGRRVSRRITALVDNKPRLLMIGNQIQHEHMNAARVTELDLKSKLRAAGITHPDQVLAVVMESTGDFSVMETGKKVDPEIFSDVAGVERLRRHLTDTPAARADWSASVTNL